MATQFGFSALSNVASPKQGGASSTSQIIYGRVKSILLDNSDPVLFNRLGQWSAVGVIEFDDVSNPSPTNSQASVLGKAFPLFSNMKFYPVIGEIVAILKMPGKEADIKSTQTVNYYFPPTNIWNSIHHNVIPVSPPIPDQQQSSYDQTSAGSPSTVSDEEPTLLLGNTFVEQSNIRPLIPYEGDYILEGRWGNSIRIGSTVKESLVANQWSSQGESGDPITILRNGQTEYDDIPGWQPIAEDINNDLSSIYLTSTQQVPFFPSTDIRDSFSKDDVTPPLTSQYQGNQILLNSGRLTFNASSDSIVMTSPNVIHLSAGKSTNIDATNRIVLSTSKVYLGDREASQKLVMGDALIIQLRKLVVVLEGLAAACNTAAAGPYPIPSFNTIGSNLEVSLQEIRRVLEDPDSPLLSQKVFTS